MNGALTSTDAIQHKKQYYNTNTNSFLKVLINWNLYLSLSLRLHPHEFALTPENTEFYSYRRQ